MEEIDAYFVYLKVTAMHIKCMCLQKETRLSKEKQDNSVNDLLFAVKCLPYMFVSTFPTIKICL